MVESSASAKLPILDFTFHPSISAFSIGQQAYLAAHAGTRFGAVGTGALVFNFSDPATPRILLVQRSASDSMPNQWETPGGGCDNEDKSILHAVARELWEEAGLKASHIDALAGKPQFFPTRSGLMVCKFNFVVQVEPDGESSIAPRLNPEEHQQFLWASESEVRSRKASDIDLNFTAQELQEAILEAFSRLEANQGRSLQ